MKEYTFSYCHPALPPSLYPHFLLSLCFALSNKGKNAPEILELHLNSIQVMKDITAHANYPVLPPSIFN